MTRFMKCGEKLSEREKKKRRGGGLLCSHWRSEKKTSVRAIQTQLSKPRTALHRRPSKTRDMSRGFRYVPSFSTKLIYERRDVQVRACVGFDMLVTRTAKCKDYVSASLLFDNAISLNVWNQATEVCEQ